MRLVFFTNLRLGTCCTAEWGCVVEHSENIKLFLTTVNILFMFFQSILTLEPLATAICLANESGIPSARLLVLLVTIRGNQQRNKKTKHKGNSSSNIYRNQTHKYSELNACSTAEFQGHLMHYLQQTAMKAFDFFHC